MKYFSILNINIYILTEVLVYGHDICEKESACSCKFSNGNKIDLSSLANNDGTARFADIDDSTSSVDLYSWNPCNDFTEDSCTNVAVCNIHQNLPDSEYFPLGSQDSAEFNTVGKTTVLKYIYQGTGGAQRTAEITLTCDKSQEGSLTASGEIPSGSGQYFFELKTKHACFPLLSPGSIILIIFFSLTACYFITGIIFQIFIKKASGKERIPNYIVWSGLPSLIKDGTVFVFTCGKRRISTYSSI